MCGKSKYTMNVSSRNSAFLLLSFFLVNLFYSCQGFVPQFPSTISSNVKSTGLGSSFRAKIDYNPMQSYNGFFSARGQFSLKGETEDSQSSEEQVPDEDTKIKMLNILDQLSKVIDPDLNQDIVSLEFIKNLRINQNMREISFDVELTTPACPIKEELKQQCYDVVNELSWVQEKNPEPYTVNITMTARPVNEANSMVLGATGLAHVSNIIAVSSCKGGVGKSTTAVNLAFALEQQGARVGLLDTDIYGPSLPTMVKPDNDNVEFIQDQIKPMFKRTGISDNGTPRGVKLMSFGYVNPGAAAIMRGPMVIQLLTQFIQLTSWGELDYLILDMPPGTGDIQLSLCQLLNITASVIVTTPTRLSFTDVVKGIDMFDTVQIPSIAVVENMAYLDTPVIGQPSFNPNSLSYDKQNTDAYWEKLIKEIKEDFNSLDKNENTKANPVNNIVDLIRSKVEQDRAQVRIFGKGHVQRLEDMWGFENIVSIPLNENVAVAGDSGLPYIVSHPNSETAKQYNSLAQSIVRECAKIKHSKDSGGSRPSVVYNENDNTIDISTPPLFAEKQKLHPPDLRRQCRCAVCVEELTGRQILQPEDVSEDTKPVENGIHPVGNYAISIDWSDGHKSLYPYSAFVKEEKEKMEESRKKMNKKRESAMA